jgi:nitroreductase
MSFKSFIKKRLPVSSIVKRQRWKTLRLLMREGKREFRRFSRAYAAPACSDQVQMESLLIFFVHQIEKGFSFDTYQYGRGRGALHNIADLSKRLSKVDSHWRDNPIRLDMVLALGEYRRRHVVANQDVSFMMDLFDEATNVDIITASKREYPSIQLLSASKIGNDVVSFSELVERRHAIRSYSDEPVKRKELEKVITMSLRTPSVCNRQPARVRIFTDRELIGEALKVQGGFGGYDAPPALLLVTADLRAFMGANEHNEGYVDGGLFAMSLLYSLEACGLAACPLNTMFGREVDERTRKLLDIPDNEVFVMYISVGHFREVSKICRSQRFGLDRILMN